VAFIGGLFPGSNLGGGLFGVGGQSTGGSQQIIGIGGSLLSSAFNADLLESGIRAINTARNFGTEVRGGDFGPATVTSLEIPESNRSLNALANVAAGPEPFFNLRDEAFDPFEGDPDQLTSFALFRSLLRLQDIVEFAALETTTDSTRRRLDTRFQEGLDETRAFLATAETNSLTFFEGSRASDADATVRLDEAESDFQGSFAFVSDTAPIEGLTGTEVFEVNISRPTGDPDVITVDLSGLSGDLSLTNVVDYINTQIEASLLLDEFGQPVLDADGNTQANSQTRFQVRQDTGGTGRYGIFVNATVTETVRLTATSAAPSLFVASNVEQTVVDRPDQVQVSEFENLSGTISQDDVFRFAATDISGTEFRDLIDEADVDPDDDVSPAVAALRDQFRADAQVDVLGEDGAEAANNAEDDDDADNIAITDVLSNARVQATTTAGGIATDSEGNIIVVGTSEGSFDNQLNTAATQDVFITKFDRQGNEVFSRLLGSSDDASAFAVTVDSQDNIIVTGQTNNALVDGDVLDGDDAFVAKFNAAGDAVFRYQLDTVGTTSGLTVTTDASNNIIVGGSTSGAISGAGAFSGQTDGFLLILDGTTGAQTGQRLFGTSGRESIQAVEVASDGNLIVASEESGQVVVRRVDATDLSNTLSSLTLGSIGTGDITGISVENNTIVISGTTTVGAPTTGGGTVVSGAQGARDGFVVGLDDTGGTLTGLFATTVGTAGVDTINDVSIAGGSVFVAGSTTSTLAGETSVGTADGFVARVNAVTGALEDTQQFGKSFTRQEVAGLAFSQQGDSALDVLGLPTGTLNRDQAVTLTTQSSARVGDYFTLQIGATRTRIEVNSDNDDLGDIARQINIAGLSARSGEVVEASVFRSSTGDRLEIKTVEGGLPLTFIRGDEGKDLLGRLGIPEGTILPTDQLFDTSDIASRVPGGVFSLDIDLDFEITSQESALFTLGRIQDALTTVQRAYRSLFPNPLADILNQPSIQGSASPAQQARLANLQDGLVRLQAAGLGSGGLNLTL